MIDAGLSSDIAEKKINDIMETGASTVVTSCQQCVRTITNYVRRNKIPLEVLDLSQLVEKMLIKT
jgi:heterodisulfide reductase subunit D